MQQNVWTDKKDRKMTVPVNRHHIPNLQDYVKEWRDAINFDHFNDLLLECTPCIITRLLLDGL